MKKIVHQFSIAVLILAGQFSNANASNIVSNDVTSILWPGGAPFTFFDAAAIGGGDTSAAASISFDRSFGTLNVGANGSVISIRGIGWASGGASAFNPTNVIGTITYLGANGTNGGGDDVIIGKVTNNVTASSSAGEWVWAFDSSIGTTIDGLSNIFRINLTAVGTGTMRFKTTSGTAASAVKLSVAGSSTPYSLPNPLDRVWQGYLSGTWDTIALNWTNLFSGTVDTYTNGTQVTFDDTLAVGLLNTNITLSATLTPLSVTFNNSSYDYSLSGGSLSGSMTLAKQAAGALTLNMANDYTGTNTLSAGVVRLGNAAGLGVGPIIFNGGRLSSDGATARTVTNAITFFSGSGILGDTVNNGTVTLSGPMDFAGGGRDIAVNSPVIFSGTTTNGGLNQKTGTGTLTYAGVTGEVNNGQCQIEGGDFVILGGNMTKSAGGIRIGNISANGISRMIITNGAQVFMTGGGLNLRVGNDQAPAANASSTNIMDISGTLAWTTNSGGIVVMGSSGAFSQINLRSGGLLKVSRFLQGVSVTELNLLGGTLGATVDTTIYLTNLTAVNISSALGAIIDTDTNSISIAQALVDPLASGGGLTKTGAGVLTLTGASTYTGSTTVSNGTLAIAVAYLATNSTVRVAAGAVLQLDFAETNNVAGFVTNGVSLAAGVYSSNNVAPFIAGTGSLQVVSVGPGLSTNAYLTSLALSPLGTLAPAFGSNVLTYTAAEAYGNTPTVTVVNSALTATNRLIYNGTTNLLASGVASAALSLNADPGITNVIQVQVTAQDGVTMNTYTVNVTQSPSQTPPTLTRSVSGSTLTLGWPLANRGWYAQTNLVSLNSASNWHDVTGSETQTNVSLTISPAIKNAFIRLNNTSIP